MTTYLADMIDQLRDLLEDAGDTQMTWARKLQYLNRGQSAMFPKIFTTARDATTLIVTDQYEYSIPAAVSNGKLIMFELESAAASAIYYRMSRYDVIPSTTSPILVLQDKPTSALSGAKIRITSANRLTSFSSANYAASATEAYTGPAGTEELPVLYAMMLSAARQVDGRNDYGKFSVQNQNGTATPIDLMNTATFWRDQFNTLLEQLAMPLPTTGI